MKKGMLLFGRLVNPAFIVLAVCLLLLTVSLYFTYQSWSYNSDDVSWQTILLTWNVFNGHVAYMGARDNFLANVPLFVLFGRFLPMNRTALFVESASFAGLNFMLFYMAGLYFLKRCRVRISYFSLMPFLWLSSFGFGFSQLYMNTDWRDFEAGVSFIFFMLAAMVCFDDVELLKTWSSRLMAGVTCVIASIFIYSDPYFLYFTIVPIVILFFAMFMMKKVSRRTLLIVTASALFSTALARIIGYGTVRAGLLIPAGTGIVLSSLHDVIPNLGHALAGLLTVFGVAYDGRSALSGTITSITSAVCNVVLVGFILYCLYRSKPSRSTIESSAPNVLALTSTFLTLLIIIIVSAYTFSNVTVVGNYRYLFLAVFAGTLLLALRSATLQKTRNVFMFVLTLATALNVVVSYSGASSVNAQAPISRPNAQNTALVDTIKRLGLTKGYTNYWDGNINTYLSAGKVEFLPVGCSKGKTDPLDLLVDSSLFKQLATKSFFVDDSINNGADPACSGPQVVAQFGQPSQEIRVSNYTIFVYSYDIAAKMPE